MKWLKFMYDIVGALKNLLGFGEAIVTHNTQRDAEKNAPDVKLAAKAQNEVKQVDTLKKDVANEDTNAIQRDLADSSGSNL